MMRKYIAVTSLDSGPMALTDEEERVGWQSRNEIAYSPQVQSVHDCRTERLPGGECAGFNERYVSDSPFDLGQLWHGNVFEAPLTPGQICTFVNFSFGFALHNPEMSDLVSLFWKQIDWIHPESYIADGDVLLTFVSRDEDIFASVRNALSDAMARAARMISWCCSFLISTVITHRLLPVAVCFSIRLAPFASICDTLPGRSLSHFSGRECPTLDPLKKQTLAMCGLGLLVLQDRRFFAL